MSAVITNILLWALLVAAVQQAPARPEYRITDIGPLPWVSDEVAPRITASGEISWWQPTPDGAIHAGTWNACTARDVGALDGFVTSIAAGANARGEIAGWSVSGKNPVDSRAHTHAFLYTGSEMIDLNPRSNRDTKATAVNDVGQVVGLFTVQDRNVHAFLYQEGELHDLGTLSGGSYSAAYAINRTGTIAGAAETGDHLIHAVVWINGHVTDIGTLGGGHRSRALALNDRGEIVGFSEAAEAETHAFLFANGRMQDLGTLGSDPVRANAINNRGQIVGASGVKPNVRHAFLWQAGAMQDLNQLVGTGGDGLLQEAVSINDAGQILCTARRPGSADRHLVLLQPSRN